ncbi:hypothetical protein ZWY2020_006631, partial [Hordeum vulgare]
IGREDEGEVKENPRVRSVDVKEALRLQNENNFVILDVRPEAEFIQLHHTYGFSFVHAHPPGVVNVQIYILIKEWTACDIARRAAFAFFGIFAGIKENPEFIKSVEEKLNKDSKIIVACSAGGTMKPTQNLPDGKQSREYREHVEDLSCLSKQFSRIVIVDNNPFSFILQPLNGIPCVPFSAGQHSDDQLMEVIFSLLKHLSVQFHSNVSLILCLLKSR